MDELFQSMIIYLIDSNIDDLYEKSKLCEKRHNLIITETFDLLENKSKTIVTPNASDIPGLYCIRNYLSKTEHEMILNKINSNIKFEPITKSVNSRRVAHFGYNYSYDRSGLTKAADIPNYLAEFVTADRINHVLKQNIITKPFDQVIINEYKPGQQISYHTDHTKQFGPIIACISIGETVRINFKSGTVEKTIRAEPKSMYIMTADARYKFQHSLKNASPGTRYSLTYRTIGL